MRRRAHLQPLDDTARIAGGNNNEANLVSATYCDIETTDGNFRAWVATPACGSGPGLILLPEIFGLNDFMRSMAERFAEEGYVCFVPDMFWRIQPGSGLPYSAFDEAIALRQQFDVEQGVQDIAAVIGALRQHNAHKGKVGALGYCMGGMLAYRAASHYDIDCAVSYYGTGIDSYLDEMKNVSCPMLFHLGENDDKVPADARLALDAAVAPHNHITSHSYADCGHSFVSPTRTSYNKPAAMIAYSRTLALLRKVMGPVYDLSMLWEKHTEYEFASRDVDATMATMVAEPYVNHVPTMTGGVGHDHLKHFYTHHFVNSNPPDTRLIPVSRTVGADRLVDEMIFCFTHTCEIPWMLPGVEATGKYVEIPLIAVVNFRGDKLYHEHIYWDQASVLVQIGKLDPAGLPVAGIQTAQKLIDETLPSNELMGDAWQAERS